MARFVQDHPVSGAPPPVIELERHQEVAVGAAGRPFRFAMRTVVERPDLKLHGG